MWRCVSCAYCVHNHLPAIYNHRMDHHTVAAVSIAGTCLDVLGSLYLAYDLLGGQHGPLRLLTRAVTYSVVFGIGYGLGSFLAWPRGLLPASPSPLNPIERRA